MKGKGRHGFGKFFNIETKVSRRVEFKRDIILRYDDDDNTIAK